MGNNSEFLEDEKKYWGKIYSDIMFALNEVSPFLEERELKNRQYYTKSDTLKNYISLLNDAECDNKKKGFLSFLGDDKSLNKIKDFKTQNRDVFSRLENCSKCECLNCTFECNFKHCLSCRPESRIANCDKERINIRRFNNYIIDLTNNNTGESNKYKVLAIMEDCSIQKQYILLENIINSNDKLILYYMPGISSDNYGEITDVDEFNFIVESYQSAE